MRIQAYKTRVFEPPQDDLYEVFRTAIKKLSEGTVVAIASKVVSIHQGRCVRKDSVKSKDELIIREADKYIPRRYVPGHYAVLTVKHNILIPSAGIDASNSGSYYVLWPKHPEKIAKEIWQWLRKTYHVKKIGIVITDSHTVPMRRGVLGVGLGYYGFRPINDYRGTKDLFGRKFKVSTTNVVDALAGAAVFAMGEGTEQTPIVIISDVPSVQFSSRPYRPKGRYSKFEIGWDEDLYGPLLKRVVWRNRKKR
ncbi:MAG: coenzyme F420-0:L-glutamate ligase [Patescibacteria group bacterium]